MIQSRTNAVKELIVSTGAIAVGIANASPVGSEDRELYNQWIHDGCHAGMQYMENHMSLRFDPTLLMPGAKSVIVIAYPYHPDKLRDPDLPMLARFAYGEDYHKALRRRLKPVCKEIECRYNCKTRICIDSAPLREKYWAFRAGVGIRGLNSLMIVPGAGSWVFLAEILTNLELQPDKSCLPVNCGHCGKCIQACPTGALRGDGTMDARKCLSYLTIEHQGELPDKIEGLSSTFFGCDRCQSVCPHNLNPCKGLAEFHSTPMSLTITAETLKELSAKQRRELLCGTSIHRRYRKD